MLSDFKQTARQSGSTKRLTGIGIGWHCKFRWLAINPVDASASKKTAPCPDARRGCLKTCRGMNHAFQIISATVLPAGMNGITWVL